MSRRSFPVDRLLLCGGGGIGVALLPAWILWLGEHFDVEARIALTRNAQRLVSTKALAAVSGHPVLVDEDGQETEPGVRHVEVSEWADAIMVAPATGNLLAKIAQGLADDLVSTALLVAQRPTVLVPSLPPGMAAKASTQRNLATLLGDGFGVAPTAVGRVAADGSHGAGAMADAPTAFAYLKRFVEGRRPAEAA